MPAFSPSCACCGCLIVDRDGFTEECNPGDWTDDAGYWKTSTSDAIKYTLSEAGVSDPWIVTAPFEVLWSGTGTEATIRVLGGFVDCDNYVYAEVLWKNWPGGTSNGYSVTIRVGEVVAGVDTILSEQPYTETRQNNSSEVSGTWSATLQLCWDGTRLACMMTGATAYRPTGTSWMLSGAGASAVAAYPVTPAGYAAGIAVVTLTDVTEVRFGAGLKFDIGRSETNTQCPACTYTCCDGPTPAELQVQIADIDPYAYLSWMNGPVLTRMDCAEIIGTFTLAKETSGTVDGDSMCRWYYTWNADAETFDGTYWNATTIPVRIRAEISTGATLYPDGRILTVTVTRNYDSGLSTVIARFSKDISLLASGHCVDWTSLFYVPTETLSGTTCHTGGGITCQLMAL